MAPPAFAHVSLVMGPDHAPLSKRHGATSVAEFRARGYLPEALTNYLALIGWSPGEGEELLPLDELASRFRLEDVGHSAGVFDLEKLAWVNRHYLKTAPPERLAALSVRAPASGRLAARADARPTWPFSRGSCRRSRPRSTGSTRCRRASGSSSTTRPSGPSIGAPCVPRTRAPRGPSCRRWRRNWPSRRRCSTATRSARWRRASATSTGQKGKALFHPIRLVLTGEPEGLELDVAVPAIEHGALLAAGGLGLRRDPQRARARASERRLAKLALRP